MAKTKGFKTGKGPQKTAEITFAEGHPLHGLHMEVQLRVPVGVILGASSGNIAQAVTPFVKRIVSWDLKDEDDNEVPVSIEAFGEHFDVSEATELVKAWVEAVTNPLEDESSDSST
jgi:hypothetical protein